MKRIMAMLVALALVAGTVQAQKADTVTTTTRTATTRQVPVTDSVITIRTVITIRDTTKPVPPDTLPTPPDTTPPAQGVLFASNWKSGDLLDGGKWTRQTYQNVIGLVSAAGHAFPNGVANLVRVQMGKDMGGYTAADWLITTGKWSVPKVGESRAFRLYFRNENENFAGGWGATHPLEMFPNGGSTPDGVKMLAMKFGNDASGTFPWVLATGEAYPKNYFAIGRDANTGTLKKNVTYRFEWKLTRTASAYTLDIRVSDPAGTVVGSASTIYAWGGGTLASSPTVGIADANIVSLRFGTNGGYSAGSRGPQYFYWGDFKVCTDWCGGN